MRAVVTTEPVQKLPQLPTLPKYHTIFLNKHHGTYRATTASSWIFHQILWTDSCALVKLWFGLPSWDCLMAPIHSNSTCINYVLFHRKALILAASGMETAKRNMMEQLPSEILVKIWLLRHGQTGGCMWPNWRMLVRRPLWNYVWWNFFSQVAKTWSPRIDGSNYTPFFQLKNFYGRENDLQSWNPTFLGVRSPNPLPISSGLGNLTRWRGLMGRGGRGGKGDKGDAGNGGDGGDEGNEGDEAGKSDENAKREKGMTGT